MSSLNVLPSAPPEKIYPELLPDNFRLSRNGAEEIEKYRKVAKKYKKAQTAAHDTAVGLGSLSAVLSTTGVAFSLTGPGIIVGALLGVVEAFCGVASAVLTNFSTKLSLKVTKPEKIYSLATTKHNSINALVSKSLKDNVVTDRKFQIINSELEKYFECVPMSNRGVFSLNTLSTTIF